MVRLAGDALDDCRRRVQQELHGHRGRNGDPLFDVRRALHTGAALLTDRQSDRIRTLFDVEAHIQVKATWGIYRRMIAAYRDPDRSHGRELMVKLIHSIATAALTEITTLGFRNLTNYIARSLLEAGGFRPRLHHGLRRAAISVRRDWRFR